jgi:hypothetical protein
MVLAVWAPGPATWPSHSFAHFINTDFDAAYSGFGLFGGNHPTNPFVAS